MLFHWSLRTRFHRCNESSVRLTIGLGNSYSTRLQSVRYSVCSRNIPQPCLDPPKSEWHDGQRRINESGKCSLKKEIQSWRLGSGMLRLSDHSGVLIGAGGERCSDWPAHVLANDVSRKIDRLHAIRQKWQPQVLFHTDDWSS